MDNTENNKYQLKHVKRQLEFYFSEGNLTNDKFMLDCIDRSSTKSVSISDLLKFNKLKQLEATKEVIQKAVEKSKILELTDDLYGVRRNRDLEKLEPVDKRLIFVSGFINETNCQESAESLCKQLKKIFKELGHVLRLDLPKYSSSDSLRGFGFVEFRTKIEAKHALKRYRLPNKIERKAETWRHFSYSNQQYNHLMKQLEMLGHPQRLFFEDLVGRNRRQRDGSPLQAVSKKEWLSFRKEFYGSQQQHIQQMKLLLETYKNADSDIKCSHKQHEQNRSSSVAAASLIVLPNELVSRSIVSFTCAEGLTKKSIRQMLKDVLDDVAYIDFKDFGQIGCLRFKKCEAAQAFAANCSHNGFLTAIVLNSNEEEEYLHKISIDKEAKRESQKRKNKRKKEKFDAKK